MRRPEADAPALLYVYDVATRRSTALTAAEEGPRKLAVASSQWTPAGDALLVEAGGDLYLLRVPGDAARGAAVSAEPRRLTSTAAEEKDPKISPDGTMVGFVRDHDLHVIDLATGAERAVTTGGTEEVANGEVDWVYDEELDISSAWWWSRGKPARIAFLQFDERPVPTYPIVDWIPTHPDLKPQHYPKAGDPNPIVRLGVAGTDGGPTKWIDLGSNTDIYVPRVAWLARGSLAVQRMNRAQTRLELLECGVETGACRAILEEKDAKWLNIGDDSSFFEKYFLWGSERDGQRHLYMYETATGRLMRQVTRGAWSVTDLAPTRENGPIFFTATEKSPIERHLYRVNLDGSGLTRLTRENGWHTTWINGTGVEPGKAMFIDSLSTANEPARITLRRIDGTLIDTLDEGVAKELAGYRRGRVEFRTVPAPDGTALPAALTLPPDFDPKKKYPVLVYVYGGPHAQVVT
ncbi:MAG TPA: DPP IV N-terminal domain-containing protein, partial [Patescibacteria group bacterium]|nr:DPP IV N-terminal domain-containing protein [Patescibacteria group bacterium]